MLKKFAWLAVLLLAVSSSFAQRYDGTAFSVQGRPIPGAGIAVCTQPAVTTTAPCSPRAILYTDATLTTTTNNPFQANQYGNYHFYANASAGLLTVQIYGAGITIPQILPDQSVNGISNLSIGSAVGGATAGLGLDVNQGLTVSQLPNVLHADKFPGVDCGIQMTNALAQAYTNGGGTVDGRGITSCTVGTANLTIGDGVHPVTVFMPLNITRGTIVSTGVSAQIFYNSLATVYATGTTISGPSDETAVAPYCAGGGVFGSQWYDGTIQDTGSTVVNSVTLQVGGPCPNGITSPSPVNSSYTTNAMQANVFDPDYNSGDYAHYSMWNTALTGAQIATLYTAGNTPGSAYPGAVTATSPLHWWTFDDTTGTSATDSGSSPLNGTYIGGFTLNTDNSIPGDNTHKSVLMNGTSGNVTFPASNYFSSANFSVGFWVKPTSGAGAIPLMSFIDGSGNSVGFADISSAWGGMYARLVINGVTTRTIFAQTSLTLNAWHFVVYVQNNGSMKLYLDGAAARTGVDVTSSKFVGITTSGADHGIELNSQHGCVCYNRLNNNYPAAKSIGVAVYNNSGFGFGVNSNYFGGTHPAAPLDVYADGGTLNQWNEMTDLENAVWNNGHPQAVAAEVTSGFAGSSYVVGDVITATLGCTTTNPTFKVVYVGATGSVGSDISATQQQLAVVNPGLDCPTGTSTTVSTTGGSGSGLKINVHVNGFTAFLDYANDIGPMYEEAGAVDYLCGGFNYVHSIGSSGNGGTYAPTLCPGTDSIFGGPHSNFIWSPGATPTSIGLHGSSPYIMFGSNNHFDPMLSLAPTSSPTFTPNLFGDGPLSNGLNAEIQGRYGHLDWNSGLDKPHAGLAGTGRTTFSKITDPVAPTVTVGAGSGSTSRAYAFACVDGNTGKTLTGSFSGGVNGPAALGAWLTITPVSGGAGGYLVNDVLTITAGATGDGTGQAKVLTVDGSGNPTSYSVQTAGSQYRTIGRFGSGDTLTFATTGGTGSGATITGTTSYMNVAYTMPDGCYSFAILEASSTNAITQAKAGWTNLSIGIDDFGNYQSVVAPNYNSTGDVNVSGIFTAARSLNFGSNSNSDNQGTITLSTGSGSYTFTQGPGASGVWTNAPTCLFFDVTNSTHQVTPTVTGSSISLTGTGSDVINYICWPRN